MDTATAAMSVAVVQDGRLLGKIESRAERNHSLYLVPHIQQLLADCGLRPADLAGFAVGQGPGSYTGVRIGVTVAKTMAWTLKRPALAVSSLEAIALGASDRLLGLELEAGGETAEAPLPESAASGRQDREASYEAEAAGTSGAKTGGDAADWPAAERVWYVPLMDARRGQVYTGLFERGPGGWRRLAEDRIVLFERWLDELAERLAEADEPPAALCLTGEADAYAEPAGRLAASSWGGRLVPLAHDVHAYEVGRLAERLAARGADGSDVHSLVPNYTQLAEAEVNLLAKTGGAKR